MCFPQSFHFDFFKDLFSHVQVFCLHVHQSVYAVPTEAREGTGFPGSTGSSETLCGW